VDDDVTGAVRLVLHTIPSLLLPAVPCLRWYNNETIVWLPPPPLPRVDDNNAAAFGNTLVSTSHNMFSSEFALLRVAMMHAISTSVVYTRHSEPVVGALVELSAIDAGTDSAPLPLLHSPPVAVDLATRPHWTNRCVHPGSK
jgi:hypothetical protein